MDFFEALEIMLKDFEKHLGWKHPEHCGSGLKIVNIVQEFEKNRAFAHNSNYAKCTAEVLQYIKYSKDSKAGRDIAEIIKKHFA